MLRISCTSHSTNVDVLQTIGVKETTMINNLKSRNMSRAGHIIRNTSGHHDTYSAENNRRKTGLKTS